MPAAFQLPVEFRRGISRRLFMLVLLVLMLVLAIAVSLAVGASGLSLAILLKLLALRHDFSDAETALLELRMHRTFLAVVAGLCLGLSGALMQAVTRNPLADPGVLGINAGAALLMVIGVAFLGTDSGDILVWLAFGGAMLAAFIVYGVSRAGPEYLLPASMTLAGVATTALLGGVTAAIVLSDPTTFDRMRGWSTGSLAGSGGAQSVTLAPFAVCGVALALVMARAMNALELGNDVAISFGANVARIRLLGGLAATLLAGVATAGAGPIAFVGLMVPHIARRAANADQKWSFACALLLGPLLLLCADILGRLIIAPAEIPAGIVVAAIGAPVFVIFSLRDRDER